MQSKKANLSDAVPSIAVYVPHYLHLSMTFTYRQLTGIAQFYPTLVMTKSISHLDLFPFAPIDVRAPTLIDRISHRLTKLISRQYISAGILQQRHWQQVLQKHNTALLHAHFAPSGMEVLPVVKRLQLPLLVTFHGYDASRLLRNKAYCNNLKPLFEYAYVITVSETMRDKLLSYGAIPEKTYRHYIGIPIEQFPPGVRKPIAEKVATGEPLMFLQVASLNEKKGHQYTLEAFQRFLPHYPNSRLVLAGDGALHSALAQQCHRLGIADRVEFLGAVDQTRVQALMQVADVFLHHSVTAADGDQEGIPTAIQEAMCAGLPTISTYHAGISEVIEDGRNSYLVQEREVEVYTQKLVALLSDDGRLGQAAAETIRTHFNLSQQNLKLLSIYDTLIREHPRG